LIALKSVSPDLLPLLKQYFGFISFRPLQEEIIRDSLVGRDVFALLPTGGRDSGPFFGGVYKARTLVCHGSF
jgi:superfamily II DNA helicase RecQ